MTQTPAKDPEMQAKIDALARQARVGSTVGIALFTALFLALPLFLLPLPFWLTLLLILAGAVIVSLAYHYLRNRTRGQSPLFSLPRPLAFLRPYLLGSHIDGAEFYALLTRTADTPVRACFETLSKRYNVARPQIGELVTWACYSGFSYLTDTWKKLDCPDIPFHDYLDIRREIYERAFGPAPTLHTRALFESHGSPQFSILSLRPQRFGHECAIHILQALLSEQSAAAGNVAVEMDFTGTPLPRLEADVIGEERNLARQVARGEMKRSEALSRQLVARKDSMLAEEPDRLPLRHTVPRDAAGNIPSSLPPTDALRLVQYLVYEFYGCPWHLVEQERDLTFQGSRGGMGTVRLILQPEEYLRIERLF